MVSFQVGFVLLLLIVTLWAHTTAYTYTSRFPYGRSYHHVVSSKGIKHGTRLKAADKTLVIWDCDGVLVDSEGDECACGCSLVHRLMFTTEDFVLHCSIIEAG